MQTPKYNDYPIDKIAKSMERRANAGAVTFFKWTCLGCGERVTANEPNTVYTKAKHEERSDGVFCGHITDCEETGGNFLFVAAVAK